MLFRGSSSSTWLRSTKSHHHPLKPPYLTSSPNANCFRSTGISRHASDKASTTSTRHFHCLSQHRPSLSHIPHKIFNMCPSNKRDHSGHHHHHENTYLTSSNKSDAGVRITRIGLAINLAMAISKGVGGYVFNSQSLSADAIHSLTDLLSDFMTLATVSWALRPPTSQFPLGYGKVESLGSVAVSSMLVIGGLYMGIAAGTDILTHYAPALMEQLHHWHLVGHIHSHSHAIPDLKAAWIAGGSVIVKEWLYRATMKIAKERHSTVLESNAIHHRVDSLTGLVALLTIGLSNFIPALSSLDAFGGLLISWMVLRAGSTNLMTSCYELLDRSIDEEIRASVQTYAEKAVATHLPNSKIKEVSGTSAGQSFLFDIEIAVPNSESIETLHKAESLIRQEIALQAHGVRRLSIRFVPSTGTVLEFAREFVAPTQVITSSSSSSSSSVSEVNHDYTHTNGHTHASGHTLANGHTHTNGHAQTDGHANGHTHKH